MALDLFSQRLRLLSAGIANISCLTEADELSGTRDLALALMCYKPLQGEQRFIRVVASWDKSPTDMVDTCNRSAALDVNIAKNVTFFDGEHIEKNHTFGQLMQLEKQRLPTEKKVWDVGAFRQAFLFLAYEGNFRGSSQSISDDDGQHAAYPGYEIDGSVQILPENGVVSQGWYQVEIINLLTASVIKRLQALPQATVFQVLEQAQLAKQCHILIKTGSRYAPLDATMDTAYQHAGRLEADGTRTVGLIVETSRSGPDLHELDQADSDED